MGNSCKKKKPSKEDKDDENLIAKKTMKSSFGWAKWAEKHGISKKHIDDTTPQANYSMDEREEKKKKKNMVRPHGSRMGEQIDGTDRTYTVVMLRHGESEANQKGLCSGWLDAPLTEKGIKQATTAGKALKDSNYHFDIAYTSMLCRANLTCETALDQVGLLGKIPMVRTWRLNEAHYGGMTGLGTEEALDKYGNDVLHHWATHFNVKPPDLNRSNYCWDDIVNNDMYEDIPPEEFPKAESLEDCMNRALVFWKNIIVPDVLKGKRVLIVAHEDVLRGLMKHLNRQSDEAIMTLHLPNSIPFVYTLNYKMKPIKVIKFLGTKSVIAHAYNYAHGYTDPRQSKGRAHPLDAPADKKKEEQKRKIRNLGAQSRIGQTFQASRGGSRNFAAQSRIGQTFQASRRGREMGSKVGAEKLPAKLPGQ